MTDEAHRKLNALATGMTVTVTLKVGREIMEQTGGSILSGGRLVKIHKQALGFGLWNLSIRKFK